MSETQNDITIDKIVSCPECGDEFIPVDTPDAQRADDGLVVCGSLCLHQYEPDMSGGTEVSIAFSAAHGRLKVVDDVGNIEDSVLVRKAREALQSKHGTGWRESAMRADGDVAKVITGDYGDIENVVTII